MFWQGEGSQQSPWHGHYVEVNVAPDGIIDVPSLGGRQDTAKARQIPSTTAAWPERGGRVVEGGSLLHSISAETTQNAASSLVFILEFDCFFRSHFVLEWKTDVCHSGGLL